MCESAVNYVVFDYRLQWSSGEHIPRAVLLKRMRTRLLISVANELTFVGSVSLIPSIVTPFFAIYDSLAAFQTYQAPIP